MNSESSSIFFVEWENIAVNQDYKGVNLKEAKRIARNRSKLLGGIAIIYKDNVTPIETFLNGKKK